MEFAWASEDVDFRSELETFLDDELTDRWHGPVAVLGSKENTDYSRRFAALLAERGWLTPHWPKEFGGADASPWMVAVLGEELWSRGEPRGPQYMNVNWIGPSIMAHGTPEQCDRYLPPIARGDAIWCQGFSEPDAGTDLASLRATAVRDGDDYIVNGTKIWTSYGDVAEHCYLLVRTHPTEKRHNGISVLLVDLPVAGLEIRTIPGIVGEHSFNELTFTDVRVPAINRLGRENHGWTRRPRGAELRASRRASLGEGIPLAGPRDLRVPAGRPVARRQPPSISSGAHEPHARPPECCATASSTNGRRTCRRHPTATWREPQW